MRLINLLKNGTVLSGVAGRPISKVLNLKHFVERLNFFYGLAREHSVYV